MFKVKGPSDLIYICKLKMQQLAEEYNGRAVILVLNNLNELLLFDSDALQLFSKGKHCPV